MIAYLDTNVYIGAKYIFDRGNFEALKKLVVAGEVSVLYTSATIGEIKAHIQNDISAAITKYNRTLRNDMPVLNEDPIYNLKIINENQAVNSVVAKLEEFVNLNGVEQISLNPLDAEKLLANYFNQNPPFEIKKPNEFKDAIMINAIKKFQETSQNRVCIVSNDGGFRKAFEKENNFITFEFLSGFLKHYNKTKEQLVYISAFISNKTDDGDFDEIIKDYLSDFDIDRGYYGEWNIDSGNIDELCCELLYVEEIDGKYIANIAVDIEISIDITYRDENASYYDKEDGTYLIENFIHAIENHRVTIDVAIKCDIKNYAGVLSLDDFYVVEDKRHKYISLGEDTMFESQEVENTLHEEPDLQYCNECGALLGSTQDGAYFDYDGNAICSKCAVSNSNGQICPMCGRKVPHEYMMAGFCKDCSPEAD